MKNEILLIFAGINLALSSMFGGISIAMNQPPWAALPNFIGGIIFLFLFFVINS